MFKNVATKLAILMLAFSLSSLPTSCEEETTTDTGDGLTVSAQI